MTIETRYQRITREQAERRASRDRPAPAPARRRRKDREIVRDRMDGGLGWRDPDGIGRDDLGESPDQ